ncbi:TetR/AcrR family transcriptional regulator [Rathayibacter sp. SD072]|uniref:TetR/AcrR family transcriptional regulator n=1 Tax=Rathayibacter sp. SD072 TaxID=2781731 RepID=UPI001A973574|nr:TetR/AcrR family transcriptional regulator [Rathayibacter sp. SD072]MBO0984010.1 TetR/AcrR family transcriptional regulator [Rathayibacter sp. SD072]
MDRREQILEAARSVIAESGVAALSVRTVAARAGIGASTLRHHFPTQRGLHDAVVAELFHAGLEDHRIADRRLDPLERLVECAGQFLPAADAPPALSGWFALHAAGLGVGATDQGRVLLEAVAASSRESTARWIAVLSEEGVLRRGPLEQHVELILALVDGLRMRMLTPGSRVGPGEALGLLEAALERAVIRD